MNVTHRISFLLITNHNESFEAEVYILETNVSLVMNNLLPDIVFCHPALGVEVKLGYS